MKRWDGETVGRWDGGTVGRWDGGTVGRWDGGTVGRWDGGTVGRWTGASSHKCTVAWMNILCETRETLKISLGCSNFARQSSRFTVSPFPLINLRLHNSDFEIIDESDDFITVNKPAHLVVHPTKPTAIPTLFDELQELLRFEITNGGQISIITRLDRETSGIVLVAKTAAAAHQFGKAMQNHEFRKIYHAIVWGWPEADEFDIKAPILRQRSVMDSELWVKQAVHPEGKPSLTKCRVLKRFERETTNGNCFSLIECEPETGRTHQIRVHLAHAGFPIVGDKIYGPDEQCYLKFIKTGWTSKLQKKLLLNRHALHATSLIWRESCWKAALPQDLSNFSQSTIRQ